jgi:hypothetical protein
MTKIKKIISGFRAADVCLLIPEMFTEIEFETNKMTKEEYEREVQSCSDFSDKVSTRQHRNKIIITQLLFQQNALVFYY